MNKLIYIAAALLAAACKKESETPAPSGANTLACQIEGQDFTPHLPPVILGTPKALDVRRVNYKGGLAITAKNSFNELTLYLYATQGPGTYALALARSPLPFGSNPDSYGGYRSIPPFVPGVTDPNHLLPPTVYYTDAANGGTVTITRFDTVAHVVGGSFSYTARTAATGKLVHITNGRFDAKF